MATIEEEILSLKAWTIQNTNNHRSKPEEIEVVKLSDALIAVAKAREDGYRDGQIAKISECIVLLEGLRSRFG